MEQHITQFFLYVGVVVVHKGVAQLEHLFYGVLTQRLVCLFGVPRAFYPECVEHIEHPA